MMWRRLALGAVSLCVVLAVLAGCSGGPAAAKGPITVGSKIDTEGGLLAQMIIQMLQANGFSVVDKSQFGPTNIVRQRHHQRRAGHLPRVHWQRRFLLQRAGLAGVE